MCAKKIIRLALLTIFIFNFSKTFSQSSPARYEWGLNLGAYVYQGDLAPGRLGSLKTIKPGIGISFARVFTPSFSIRAMFNLASLKGDETKYKIPDYRKFRAFKFTNAVKEFSMTAHWNLVGTKEYQTKFEPYLFAGLGLSFMKVKRDYSSFNAAYFSEANNLQARLATDLTERADRTIAVVPAGAGLRYNLSSSVVLNLETSYRFSGSDYIDGFSIAANTAKNDHFFSETIGISFKIGKKNKMGCPVMKY